MIATTKSSSEPVSPRDASSGPEFLVVCADSNVFRAVAMAVRKVKGRLNCASAVSSARDYLARRKVDGIVLDLRLDGAMEMVLQLRAANLGKSMVIFACSRHDAETQAALRAGANFVLGQPLIADKIANIFSLAATMMTSEKRRYPRQAELRLEG